MATARPLPPTSPPLPPSKWLSFRASPPWHWPDPFLRFPPTVCGAMLLPAPSPDLLPVCFTGLTPICSGAFPGCFAAPWLFGVSTSHYARALAPNFDLPPPMAVPVLMRRRHAPACAKAHALLRRSRLDPPSTTFLWPLFSPPSSGSALATDWFQPQLRPPHAGASRKGVCNESSFTFRCRISLSHAAVVGHQKHEHHASQRGGGASSTAQLGPR